MSPQGFGTFIDLTKPCGGISFKPEAILGGHTFCQGQMLLNVWINPASPHGWLMFLLWKQWGPCEISKGQQYQDNDKLGAIDLAMNWVRVAICATSKCNNSVYYFRKTSKLLLPLGNKISTSYEWKYFSGELCSSVKAPCVFSIHSRA